MAPLSDREICFAALALSCASYLQPLCLSFLFWRMGIIRVSPFTVTDKAPDMCGCTAWHKTWAQSAPLAMSSITTHIPYLHKRSSRGWQEPGEGGGTGSEPTWEPWPSLLTPGDSTGGECLFSESAWKLVIIWLMTIPQRASVPRWWV